MHVKWLQLISNADLNDLRFKKNLIKHSYNRIHAGLSI